MNLAITNGYKRHQCQSKTATIIRKDHYNHSSTIVIVLIEIVLIISRISIDYNSIDSNNICTYI